MRPLANGRQLGFGTPGGGEEPWIARAVRDSIAPRVRGLPDAPAPYLRK
jgi:hypothetical protein